MKNCLWIAFLTSAWIVAVGGHAVASTQPAADKRAVVMIAARDRVASALEAIQAIRGQFSDSSVVLRFVWVDRVEPNPWTQRSFARKISKELKAISVLWHVVTPKGGGRLFIFLPERDRVLARCLEKTAAGERTETLAIIVRSTVDALLKGEQLEARWQPARHPLERKKSRSRSRPRAAPSKGRAATSVSKRAVSKGSDRRWLSLDAAYALDGYSTDVGATHGFYAAISVHLHRYWSFVLDYRVVQKVEGTAGQVSTRIMRHPVGMGVRFGWRRGRFGVGGGLSMIVDYATYRTEVGPGVPAQPVGSDGGFLWSVAAVTRGSIQVAWHLKVFVSVGAQVGLNYRRYVVEAVQGDRTVLVNPWPVQPLAFVGISADVF